MAGRNGHSNGNGDIASHTLRLLRDIRSNMVTKADLAKVEARLGAKIDGAEGRLDAKIDGVDAKIDRVETRLGRRIDVLGRIFKENHRVLAGRVRALESDSPPPRSP